MTSGVGLASAMRLTLAGYYRDVFREFGYLRQGECQPEWLWPQEDVADDEPGVFISAETTPLLGTARRGGLTDISVLLTGDIGGGYDGLGLAIHCASACAGEFLDLRQPGNEIRRVVALVEPDGAITPHTLSSDIRASRGMMAVDATPQHDEVVIRTDRALACTLEHVDGGFDAAANLLGVTHKGLSLRRKRLGLDTDLTA